MYAVESNVPLPAKIRGRGRPLKVVPPKPLKVGRPPLYPFREMEVGDSFFVPLGDRNVIWTCGNRIARELSREFKVIYVPRGVRVWRTA